MKSKSISREINTEVYKRLYNQNIKNQKKMQEGEKSQQKSINEMAEVSRDRSVSFAKSPRLTADEITKKLYDDA